MGSVLINKEEERVFSKKFYLFIVLSILVFLIVGFLVYSSHEVVNPIKKCGDGTFDESCSLKKPYFCSGGFLIENPIQCGCPDSFKFSKEGCFSEYSIENQERKFNYFLDGEKKEISFNVFPGVVDYLLNLTRIKVYYDGEIPRMDDFKLSKINDPVQRDYILSLVSEIENLASNSKDTQAEIAVSLVQNIPYNESQFKEIPGFDSKIRLSRYPYQVLYENQGSCEDKSELLVLLLKELGFGVTLFDYSEENHEAVGIKCPIEKSYLETGYCFVETTMPSPISFSEGRYLGLSGEGRLMSKPEIILVSEGISLSENLEDYADADSLAKLVDKIENTRKLNYFDKYKMDNLRDKYQLNF